MPDQHPKVHIATITKSHLWAGLVGSVDSSRQYPPHPTFSKWEVIAGGPYLGQNRNNAIRADADTGLGFYANTDNPDICLFIDSDIAFNVAAYEAVVSRCTPDHPVVGGWYNNPQPDGAIWPVVLNWGQAVDDEGALGELGFHQLTPEDLEWHPSMGDPAMEVGAMGTGFMALHRTFLDTLAAKYSPPVEWFDDVIAGDPPKKLGEDLSICLRAIDLGFTPLVVRSAKVSHYKDLII